MSDDQSKPEALELLQIWAIAFCDKVKGLESVVEVDEAGRLLLAEGEPSAGAALPSRVIDESLAGLLARERARSSFNGMEWCGPVQQLSINVAFFANILLSLADPVITELEAHSSHQAGCRCARLSPLLHETIGPAIGESDELLRAIERLIPKSS
jgi:hypothetical protein